MRKEFKDDSVLLVETPEHDTLRVVTGLDIDGNLKTTAPKQKNEKDFMKIDKHGNVLDNFFTNFMRQVKDPSRFNFFDAPAIGIERSSAFVQQMLDNREDPPCFAFLESAKIIPLDYVDKTKIIALPERMADVEQIKQTEMNQKNEYKPLDAERIDWAQFEKLGIKRDTLEKSGALEQMLNYRKSPNLMDITAQLGDTTIRTQARLSLRENEQGAIVPVLHAIRKEPQLDRPFYGHTFTNEDKASLRETGNLGRIVELTNRTTGEVIPSLVSIDKQTNELVTQRADKVKIPNEIKGVTLDDKQKQQLSEGKAVYIEGMTAKSGKTFDAFVQYNADKRGIEFRFDETKQQQSHTQTTKQGEEVRIPNKLGGVELTDKQQDKLREGGTIYVQGLKDKQGQEYNAYVKINPEEGKLDFYKWNPDKAKSKEITPDNKSTTQVAVNSEGKTNEATKHQNEPLKQEQQQPRQRSRGMKM